MNPLNLVTCPVTVRALLFLEDYSRNKIIGFLNKKITDLNRTHILSDCLEKDKFLPDYSHYQSGIEQIRFFILPQKRFACKISFGEDIFYFAGKLYPGGEVSETVIQSCSGRKMTDVIGSGIFHGLNCSKLQDSEQKIKGPDLDVGLTKNPVKKMENLLRKEAQAYQKWVSHERIAA
jgi:hypothetical protein